MNNSNAITAGAGFTSLEDATYAKITWRLMPLLMLCYVLAYLDRVNVGFAKLQMASDLKFSETAFGLGAGVFFIGYFLLEIPSNLILVKVGARRWIARIMIVWGLISGAMMFVTTPASYYLLRFLLGLAEAGFFPAVIYYLTQWYPSHRRAKVIAFFMAAAPLAGVIGGPLSGYIMQTMQGLHGLAGWQWMFILEALPSVLVGLFVFFYLNDEVSEAGWLTEQEKQLVRDDVHAESREKPQLSLSLMFANGRVWLTAFLYFCFVMSGYAISFWLPTLIKATGVKSLLDIGLLSSIPFGAAIITMMIVSRSADKKRERRWHVALPAIVGAIGLVASAAFSHNTWLAMAALTIASAGIFTIYPIFWSLPTAFLSGTAAAAGIALINSLGNLAGFVSPYLVGWVKDMTQSTSLGMGILAFFLLLGAALTFTLPARLVNK